MKITVNIAPLIKSVITYGFLIGAGYYVHQHAVPGEISWKIASAGLTILWVVRVIHATITGYRKTRKKIGGAISMENIGQVGTAIMPDWTLGYYNTEKNIYKHAWRVMKFEPINADGGFSTFVPRANGVKVMLLSVMAVALLAWSINAVLAWLGTSSGGIIGAMVLVALAAYMVAWLTGDWRATREIQHRIGDRELQLNLGVRSAVTIPLSDIERCAAIPKARVSIGNGEGNAPLRMTVSGSCNVLVELFSKQDIVVTRFGYPFPVNTSAIALHLVDPAKFVDMLTKKLQAREAKTGKPDRA